MQDAVARWSAHLRCPLARNEVGEERHPASRGAFHCRAGLRPHVELRAPCGGRFAGCLLAGIGDARGRADRLDFVGVLDRPGGRKFGAHIHDRDAVTEERGHERARQGRCVCGDFTGTCESLTGQPRRQRGPIHVFDCEPGKCARLDSLAHAAGLVLAHDREQGAVRIEDHERCHRERARAILDVRREPGQPRHRREVAAEQRPAAC